MLLPHCLELLAENVAGGGATGLCRGLLHYLVLFPAPL